MPYVHSNRTEEIRGWSYLCAVIRRRARQSAGSIEKTLEVGQGDGRLWRRWMAGERLARRYTRQAIVKAALSRGWLRRNDVHVAEALEYAGLVPPHAPISLPPHPYGVRSRAAVVAELLADTGHRRFERLHRMAKNHDWLCDWLAAVRKARKLLQTWSQARLYASLNYCG